MRRLAARLESLVPEAVAMAVGSFAGYSAMRALREAGLPQLQDPSWQACQAAAPAAADALERLCPGAPAVLLCFATVYGLERSYPDVQPRKKTGLSGCKSSAPRRGWLYK